MALMCVGHDLAEPAQAISQEDTSYLRTNASSDPEDAFVICEELGEVASEPPGVPDMELVAERAEYEQSSEDMVEEVVALWELFFEDDGAGAHDPRRKDFYRFAEYLVDAVVLYQDVPTDIGGKLPRHKNVHLLFATMVTMESSVDHDVVGKLGEVGLLQIMPKGPAIAGYAPEEVQHSPRLGLWLGIRWLASRVDKCRTGNIEGWAWDDYNWLGPLSLYAAGWKAKKKDGTCAIYGVARKRVNRTLLYRSRIDGGRSVGWQD
jgi:hypothetical protein